MANENQQLRATVLNQGYELRQVQTAYKLEVNKMRSDVTKALIAFESRLHLQLQQQLGFKPGRTNNPAKQSGAGVFFFSSGFCC